MLLWTELGKPDPVAAGRPEEFAEARSRAERALLAYMACEGRASPRFHHFAGSRRVTARTDNRRHSALPVDQDPMPPRSGKERRRLGGYRRRRSPLGLAGLDHCQASLHPTHWRPTKCPGTRGEAHCWAGRLISGAGAGYRLAPRKCPTRAGNSRPALLSAQEAKGRLRLRRRLAELHQSPTSRRADEIAIRRQRDLLGQRLLRRGSAIRRTRVRVVDRGSIRRRRRSRNRGRRNSRRLPTPRR